MRTFDQGFSSLVGTPGTAGFTAASSTYDANGSLTNQYGGSAASADSFGAYAEADTSASTSTGQTATAATAGLGGAVVTCVNERGELTHLRAPTFDPPDGHVG